jgi:hypothetical protein
MFRMEVDGFVKHRTDVWKAQASLEYLSNLYIKTLQVHEISHHPALIYWQIQMLSIRGHLNVHSDYH